MFNGSLVALITPMEVGGAIDYIAMHRLVAWHLANNTDALVILGSTGEAATILAEERVELIQQVVKQVNGQLPIVVGTGSNSTQHAIALTRQAMELGADATLLVTPYYNKPTQEGLLRHFKTIAEAVPIPQILYNVPARTACDLLPETVLQLIDCPNIVGLKEATGEIDRVKKLVAAGADHHIDLLSGDDQTALEFMLAGGKGVISVIANIVPKACHAMCVAAMSGNCTLAARINDKLRPLYQQLFRQSNPIVVKWAVSQMGMIDAGIRLPLTPLAGKFYPDVREAMRCADVEIK